MIIDLRPSITSDREIVNRKIPSIKPGIYRPPTRTFTREHEKKQRLPVIEMAKGRRGPLNFEGRRDPLWLSAN